MDQRIIFKSAVGDVGVLTPADGDMTIEQIAAKDVPEGAEFWIVSADDLPAREDRHLFAWNPDATRVDVVPVLDENGESVVDENGDAVVENVTVPAPAWEPLPPVDPVIAWRETAALEKGEFLVACVSFKILPEAEAIDAAKGNWPATFAALFAGLDAATALKTQIEWATVASVRRVHPIIGALAAIAKLTDAQVDALFGWADNAN